MGVKKKIKWKSKLIRCSKGAISILLCLVMTPFLSVSLAMVEYSRYQQVYELVDEFEELTGVSIISDYDQYIHNRFGLLAVSQSQDMKAVAEQYMKTNISALGSQVTLHSTTVSGRLALSQTSVIKKQILDVSETTGLAQVLMEDFNLDELKKKLLNLSGFDSAFDTIDDAGDLAESLEAAVTAADTLKTSVEDLREKLSSDSVSSIVKKANTLSEKAFDLFEKFSAEGYTIPETLDGEEWDEILLSLTGDYEADLISVFGAAKDVINDVQSIKDYADKVAENAKKLEEAVNKVSIDADKLGSEGEDNGSAIASTASATLENVAKEIKKIAADSLNNVKESAMKTLKESASKIVDNALEKVGLADALDRYSAISSGKYFESEVGKNDLKKLISLIPEVWNEKSPEAVREEIKNMLVPTIDFSMSNLNGIIEDIDDIIKAAGGEITTSVDNTGFDTLTRLANIIRGLFKLNVLYDPELNAKVTLDESKKSEYQKFLDGLGGALNAADGFIVSVSEGAFLQALKEIANLFKSFGALLTALKDIIVAKVNNIANIFTEGFSGLYDRLLLAGYATHNFPNRTNNSNQLEKDYNGALSTTRLILNGTGLTGFSYNQIARPSNCGTQKILEGSLGISGLSGTLEGLFGNGTDYMFKGAEMEYVIAGTTSELANQIICFFDLYFIRMICNLGAVFVSDTVVQGIAATCNIACWVVYILYAVIEPFCDCILLVNGSTVPIVKTKCFMGEDISSFVNKLGNATMSKEMLASVNSALGTNAKKEDSGSSGSSSSSGIADLVNVDYSTHLLILALLNNEPDTTASRIGTLVELETKEYYRQKSVKFCWDKTYTSVIVTADIDVNSFFDIGVMNGSGPIRINSKKVQSVGY